MPPLCVALRVLHLASTVCWLFLVARSSAESKPLALRSAVPILCTESHLAARTRVRGTAVIADSGGTLLTAAHVIERARSDCTLSVMIPDEEWSSFRQLHAFLVRDCRLHKPLDIAVCHLRPADNSRDWGYIRAAKIRFRPAVPGESVHITAFTGWGLIPLVRSGRIEGRQIYQRSDGCYCDFVTDIPVEEGMSGSPVISAQGEVLGILTLSGSGKFRGVSFGASFVEAAVFLKTQGVIAAPDFPRVQSPASP